MNPGHPLPLRRRPPALLLLAGLLLLGASLLPLPAAGAVQDSPAAARVARGNQLLEEGDAVRAAREFEGGILADPLHAPAHEGAVRAWTAAREFKKAIAAGKAGAEKCPEDASILVALCRAHLQGGSNADALVVADRALAAPSPPPAAWRVKADAVAATDLEGAAAGEKVLLGGMARFPGEPGFLLELGSFLLAHGRPADAVPHARKFVAKEERRLDGRVLLVRALLLAKQFPEAREAAIDAEQDFPESDAAAALLGRTFEEAGEPAGALAHYERASKLAPKKAAHLVSIGYVLGRMDRWKDAEKVLRSALRLEGDDTEARLHLGWVLNSTGDLSGALAEYQAVLKARPDHPRALWYCADLSVSLGKGKDGERYLDRLLALQPFHSEAYRLLALLNFRMGKSEEARRHLARCLEYDPKNARGLFLQGMIHDDEGAWEDAEKSYLAAAEADPKLPWPHLYLGELYDEALSRPPQALASFRKFLELGGPDPDGHVQRVIEALEKEVPK